MIGLPTETDEDVLGIRDLGYKVKDYVFSQQRIKRKAKLKVN